MNLLIHPLHLSEGGVIFRFKRVSHDPKECVIANSFDERPQLLFIESFIASVDYHDYVGIRFLLTASCRNRIKAELNRANQRGN